MEQEELQPIDKKDISSVYPWLITSGLITEQGVRIQGNGIIIKKLDDIWKKLDQISLRVYKMEEKMR